MNPPPDQMCMVFRHDGERFAATLRIIGHLWPHPYWDVAGGGPCIKFNARDLWMPWPDKPVLQGVELPTNPATCEGD